MKKIYAVLAFMVLFGTFAHAQCTIDSSHLATPGVYPGPDSLPCVIKNVLYDRTIQGRIPQSTDTTLHGLPIVDSAHAHIIIDSLRLDSVLGLPTGITAIPNPRVLKGGQTGCVLFSGTTTDTVGKYVLTGYGKIWTHAHVTSPIHFDTAYVYTGNMSKVSPFGNYYLTVVDSFTHCTHVNLTDIRDFNTDLASSISVYPNPTSGVFEFKLEAGNRVNGDVVIMDMTGRTVYTQKLDVLGLYTTSIDLSRFAKGLYTLQLRTAGGFASKNISVE